MAEGRNDASGGTQPYYQDEWVTIYHGDCRAVLPRDFGTANLADVLITDPPYGIAYRQGRRVNGRAPGWTSRWTDVPIAGDSDTSLRDWVLSEWLGPALVFGTWKMPMPEDVREVLVWDKVVSTGMGALDIPWRPSWEAIYVIGGEFTGDRSHGVLRYSLPTLAPERAWHPTPKPVDLMRHLVGKTLGTVLDPFMGSGSTLRAAKDLGRRAIGVEIEERYCEVAARRMGQEVMAL